MTLPRGTGAAESEALLEFLYDGATDVEVSMRKDNRVEGVRRALHLLFVVLVLR